MPLGTLDPLCLRVVWLCFMASPRLLLSWIGSTDLRAPTVAAELGGPILAALRDRSFDAVVLLNDHRDGVAEPYLAWLRAATSVPITVEDAFVSTPVAYGEIYHAAARTCAVVRERFGADTQLTFHLSPGSPAMQAVWIILAKTRFPAALIQGSKRHGIEDADVPLAITAELLSDAGLAAGRAPPPAPAFAGILHKSPAMRHVIALAGRAAPLDVPVLIEGESGTGKELLARALHDASPRAAAPFIAINCGALPTGTVESELFGHERGAFTGADRLRKGHFEEASGGTLFLDEVAELPLAAQVKLLRVLQENEVTRLGASHPITVNVRVVAATNRSLLEEVRARRFRQDLLYRLAWGVLKVPPLRERGDDLDMLVTHVLATINKRAGPSTFERKILSAAGRKRLGQHPWPGNVRELVNTLWRAALWSEGPTITESDVEAALLPSLTSPSDGILDRPLGNGLDVPAILDEVERHYLSRSLAEAHGNKAEAARLVGIKERKTFAYRLKRHGL